QDHALAHARAAHRNDIGRCDGRALQRLPDAFPDDDPVALRVEDLGPGRVGERGMRPLPLTDRRLRPVLPEQDRATAAGAEVDRQGVPHRAIGGVGGAASAARSAPLTSGSPRKNRSISAAAISPLWRSVSWVAPPICVVTITFGWSRSGC